MWATVYLAAICVCMGKGTTSQVTSSVSPTSSTTTQVTSSVSPTSSTTTQVTSSISSTPHIPGLGERCHGICSPNATVYCVNNTCQCRPPLTNTTKYCVTEPGKVVDFRATYISNDTVILAWSPPTTIGVIEEYHIFGVVDGQCDQGLFLACHDTKSPTFINRTSTCFYLNWFTVIDCHNNHLTFNGTSLWSYTNYTWIISANNDLYNGKNTSLDIQTNISAAMPPNNVRATVLNSSAILVDWTIPTRKTGPTWYTVICMEATGRHSSQFKALFSTRVDGFNSTSLLLAGLKPPLLSSWEYTFTITAHTQAGDSPPVNLPKPVRTRPSAPDPVEDLDVTALDTALMGVELTWSCPKERHRNGFITSYTVQYKGDISYSQTYGSYQPEDQCLGTKTIVIPIAPAVNYSFTVFANAEFQGKIASTVYHADQSRLAFVLPGDVIIVDAPSESTSSTLLAVSVVFTVVIVSLIIAIIFSIYKRRKHSSAKINSVN